MIDITHILPHITGKKVLVQLSGGKDSLACLILLKEIGIKLEAIHFIHAYNYSLPTEMAKMACEKFGVRLYTIDVTADLSKLLLGGFKGRPCRLCKSIMDRITVDIAEQNNHQIICIGDTCDDKTLINRLLDCEGEMRVLSRYINKAVVLPSEIAVIRPLLKYHGDEIAVFVKSKFPDFKRVHDTGDKYFDYSREGCPLQFKDMGAEYTEDMIRNLKHYNSLCSEFAISKNIRASIHLPSEFIVTIPKGYEDECRKYLIKNGCMLRNHRPLLSPRFATTAHVRTNGITLSADIMSEAFARLIERLGLKTTYLVENPSNIMIGGECFDADCFIVSSQIISITIISSFSINIKILGRICMEIFHTYDFSVSNSKI